MDKIKPLLKFFSVFKEIYEPSTCLCIDEMVAPFAGRFKYLTYNPLKPHKWGIRIIGLADSTNGYCLSLIPQLGEETYKYLGVKDLDELIVQWMKNFASEGASLYVDNYYCHFLLAEKLLREGFNVTGTYRLTRKSVPSIIQDAVVKKKVVSKNKKEKITTTTTTTCTKSKAEEGKPIRYFKSTHGIYAVKWKAKKEVNVLTTNHSLESESQDTARNREITRPHAINEYIKYMRGIDRLNQRVHYIR